MKKVLIITYYWPPSGGAGVQRWLKFVKYLRSEGWEPVVYTAKNAHYPILDESLSKDIPADVTILKNEIWEPFDLYKKFIGASKKDKFQHGFIEEENKKGSGVLKNLSVWIRGNIFIPDARAFWIIPSAKFLIKYLKNEPVDLIISTGPPHSMHLIAKRIKNKYNIPWIADLRDPWTNIDFYDQLKLTRLADSIHKKLEHSVMNTADEVLTVSWTWANEFKELGAEKVSVITNGYDQDDFKDINEDLSDKFEITHAGSFTKDRNPEQLWKVLGALTQELPTFREDLKITLLGKTDHSIFENIRSAGIEGNVFNEKYLPHDETIRVLCRSQVLLLLINDAANQGGRIPGKIFEYLAAERPVINIGPVTGDSARIIAECDAGITFNYDEFEPLKEYIEKLYADFKVNHLKLPNNRDIGKYSRRELTKKLADLFSRHA